MDKIFIKRLFFTVLLLLVSYISFAQTITITSVDPGPYGQGSTIAALIKIDNTTGCIKTDNKFDLYLSDKNGSFAAETKITSGNYTNIFYTTYVNGLIPSNTPAGSNYMLRVKSSYTAPSAPSAPFSINAVPGVVAQVSSNQLSPLKYPDIFGLCSGSNNAPFPITNQSSAIDASTSITGVNVNITDEITGVASPTMSFTTANQMQSFTAATDHYTVYVKATNSAGIVGTKAYFIINNISITGFQTTGVGTVCLPNAVVTFPVEYASIKNNFPGLYYSVQWGDGKTDTYTACDFVAKQEISHTYETSSCGNKPIYFGSKTYYNSFGINIGDESPYCGDVGTPIGTAVQAATAPKNSFDDPKIGCTGSTIVFKNTSTLGEAPNQTSPICSQNTLTYYWYVNGVQKSGPVSINTPFTYTFPTKGTYDIKLHSEGSAACPSQDTTMSICIQDPPKPSFTLPATEICTGSGPLVPTNTSVVDNTCSAPGKYIWTVSPQTGVSFNASSQNPQFAFSNPGTYQITLTIDAGSCDPVTTKPQTVTVNSSPVTTLSKDFSQCGTNQTLKFTNNATNNPTYTILSGTSDEKADTYTWTVTGGNYNYEPGFTANSKYPSITFTDYATYTVTVTQTNNCGSQSSTQKITFQKAPTVNAGADQTICASDVAQLNGQIPDLNGVISYTWIGNGKFSPNATTLNATYQPTNAEIKAGTATVTLQATTSIAAPCNLITSAVTITVAPVDVINSKLSASICSNTKLNYTATSPDANATFKWTSSLISGSASGFTTSGSGASINDLLVNTDPSASTNAVIAYIITPTNSLGCQGTPSTLTVTVTPLPLIRVTVANASTCSNQQAGITLTSSVTGTNYTWTSTASAGITGNTNNTVPSPGTAINDILINNGTTQGTVTYTITPISSTGCTGTPVQAQVIVQPAPVTANAGSNESICNVTSFNLKGNSPGAGTGKWTVSPSAGITFSDDTSPTSAVNGLVPGNTYQFTWTITSAPGCSNSNSINITVNAPTIAGTTSTPDQSTVCAGNNSGQIVLSGSLGAVVNWETSIDNGTTWAPVTPVNTGTNLVYANLAQTTQFRAIVQNGQCSVQTSTVTTITVNQPAVTAYAGPNQNLCNVTSYTMQGNDPGTFVAHWTQLTGPSVTFADPTKYNTTISGLQGGNVYTFKWTIEAVTPCASSENEVVITDAADVTPSFTADKTDFCGEQNVTFTNTSNDQAGASFSWDFGDGSPVSNEVSPHHVFEEDPSGKDITYHVTLTVLKNCAVHQPVEQDITVRPAVPDAEMSLDKYSGCGPTNFTVQNLSKGTSDTYVITVKDLQGNVVYQTTPTTDKSAIVIPLTSSTNAKYGFTITATNKCGTVNTSQPIYVQMSPADIAANISTKDNQIQCYPFTTTLINASGGISYYYTITKPDGTTINITAVSGSQPYEFPAPGNYKIQLFASDACATNIPSNVLNYTLYPQPAPDFTSTIDCQNTVTFTNTTPDPNNLFAYSWDFGDGSAPSPNPTHQYVYDAKHSDFNVTLTATNTSTDCSNTIQHTIHTSPLLTAAFEVLPGNVISIPNYHFNFVDQSSGSPTSWLWDFGDGETSTDQNPGHTYAYANVGDHTVTLTVSKDNCSTSSTTQVVTITGVPGQLFLPNAFIPSSSINGINLFVAKGAGIKSWHMQIFNNYGQLIWETTKLDSKGSPVDGWDGTYKGAPAPQGAYIWQVQATFINGTEWKGMSYNGSLPKRTGTVNLIR